MSSEKAPAIGIDLGTSYASVGVFQNGKVTIIADDQGNVRTPTCVSFLGTERVIGDAARNLVTMNPANTIFDALRLIGRKFEDPLVQGFMMNWPFEVISDDGGRPKISVELKKGERKSFFPEEICSMVLSKMKTTAAKHLGRPVTNAVITVPANFNYFQRQAIRDAGTIAGLNVLRILSAPVAAAIAYHFLGRGRPNVDEKPIATGDDMEGKNLLIFDLGGGTLDVSIVTIECGDLFEVRSTAGNNQLGGEDFDNRVLTRLVEEFSRKFEKDMTSHFTRDACETAKITLSGSTKAFIQIDGTDFHKLITRSRFEAVNNDLFEKALESVEKCLRNARMEKSEIHDVVLFGGSTRIPKIQQLLKTFFNGKRVKTFQNFDEAVAYGAALQAAIISGNGSEEIQDFLVLDTVPFNLGVETAGGVMDTIIPGNTGIPTKGSKIFNISTENQPVLVIKVYEGEKAMTKDNDLLGELEFPAPPGVAEVEVDVTFDIDANGILRVTVMEIVTENLKEVRVTFDKGHFSNQEMERMVNDAEEYNEAEEEIRRRRLEGFGSGEPTIKKEAEEPMSVDLAMDQSKPLNVSVSKDRFADFDFVIVSRSGAELKCHKELLCEHSRVFRAMIQCSATEAVTKRLEMVDMKEESVKALLAFLYYRDTTEASENFVTAYELLCAARQYDIKILEIIMKGIILTEGTSWFCVDDAVRLFAFAHHLDNEEDLKMKAVEVLKKNISTLGKSDCYKHLFNNYPEAAMELYKSSFSK